MERKQIISKFMETAENPFLYLKNWKAQTGKKILGYFCTNTPEEIIQAAGFLPVRLLGTKESISMAAKHLQSYSCSLVQSSLESALRGDLSFLDGTIFPHTCDSIQRLSDIWAENLGFPFHWDLVLPVKLHTESARIYLIQELHRFRRGLQEFTACPISDEDLRSSIVLANANRLLLRKLYGIKNRNSILFSAAEFSAIVKTATLWPKAEHNAMIERLISWAEKSPPVANAGIRLFIAGSVCDQLSFFNLVDTCGVSIVGDDLCTGWRYFSEDVPATGNPIEALAERLIRKVPCPCKYNPNFDRGTDLLQRVKNSNAQGVVFLHLKFCDPHAFDYPYLKKRLDEKNIPSLLLEIEPGGITLGSVETRLKAFIETLEA
ncbi:MAG: 2-hydroxyacyl-CoA dehydratase family protein [Pseudomonadota bacterium]